MSMLNVQIYIYKIRHLLSGVIFRFLSVSSSEGLEETKI